MGSSFFDCTSDLLTQHISIRIVCYRVKGERVNRERPSMKQKTALHFLPVVALLQVHEGLNQVLWIHSISPLPAHVYARLAKKAEENLQSHGARRIANDQETDT